MSDAEDQVTIGEVARRLGRIETKQDQFYAEAVLRSEFEARLTTHDREIRDLKGTKVQWPSVAAVVVAAIALLVVIIPLIANG